MTNGCVLLLPSGHPCQPPTAQSFPELTGVSFGEIAFRFDAGIVLGFVNRSTRRARLNPPIKRKVRGRRSRWRGRGAAAVLGVKAAVRAFVSRSTRRAQPAQPARQAGAEGCWGVVVCWGDWGGGRARGGAAAWGSTPCVK